MTVKAASKLQLAVIIIIMHIAMHIMNTSIYDYEYDYV